MKDKNSFRKLVYDLWKSRMFSSKIDLIKFLKDNYYANDDDIQVVYDVLSNIKKDSFDDVDWVQDADNIKFQIFILKIN